MAQVVSKKCAVCEENNSKLLCYECNQELCEMCRPVHDKFSANKQHTIVDNRDVTCINYAEKLKCKTHDQESRCLCLTCSSLICAECIIDEHKNHDVKSIKTMAYDYRMDLSKTESKVKAEMEMLLNLKSRIKNKKKTLSEAFNLIERDLKSSIDDVQNIVKGVADEYIATTKTHLIKQEEMGNFELHQVEMTENVYETFLKTLTELKKEKHDGSFVTRFMWIQDDIENLKEMPSVQPEEGFKSFERREFLSAISNAITPSIEVGIQTEPLVVTVSTEIDRNEEEAEIQELIKTIKDLKEELESKDLEVKTSQHTCEIILKETDRLYEHQTKLEKEINILHKENERLLNLLKKPENDIKQKYKQLLPKHRKFKKEKDELQRRCEEYESNFKQLTAQKQRLSMVAGRKMKDNNPAIADLSDPNRPERLTEQFREIYDNAWTDVLDCLTENEKVKDEVAVKQIVDVLQAIYEQCKCQIEKRKQTIIKLIGYPEDTLEKQYTGGKDGHDPTVKIIKDLVQGSAGRIWEEVIQEIKKTPVVTEILQTGEEKSDIFVTKCSHLCLFMVVQDPPVVLDFSCQPGDPFNKDLFTPFMSSGDIVDYLVWPVTYLSQGGAIMSKGSGIATGKKTIANKQNEDN